MASSNEGASDGDGRSGITEAAADLGPHQLDQRPQGGLVAQELGLVFQRTDAGGRFGVVQTPAYRALNPNALVPTIEVDDASDAGRPGGRFRLWESNVIVRYLCGPALARRLYPEPLPARFDAERWMDWQQTTLNPATATRSCNGCARPPSSATRRAARSVQATEPLLAMLDAHLATRAFMGGERFTMADIPIGCELHRWFGLPAELYSRPVGRTWSATSRRCARGRRRAGARPGAGVGTTSGPACCLKPARKQDVSRQ
jgi:glutathione S-transferase